MRPASASGRTREVDVFDGTIRGGGVATTRSVGFPTVRGAHSPSADPLPSKMDMAICLASLSLFTASIICADPCSRSTSSQVDMHGHMRAMTFAGGS